ncbi:MAG: ethanolamine ammonia-lyase reactivating factor EutA, partial [Anaerolineae bacterium]
MSRQTRHMLSVGIDVGTTTTQLVFSRLTLAIGPAGGATPLGRAPLTRPGAPGVVDKKVLYRSEVYFTPLRGPDEVDAPALEQIVRREYQRAGIAPAQVESGAVIITGETAKKQNADAILEALSALAGDFVVTVAGPHLESMMSGRGSGAAAYSREHYTTVTNVDIGGGSANSAIFRQGELLAAAAMNYGGRIIELDPSGGQIQHLAQPARIILTHLGLPLQVGDRPTLTHLQTITGCMADLTVELIEGPRSPLAQELLLTPPASMSGAGTVLCFSGGIGHYYYHPLTLRTVTDVARHGDIGPLLAESIRLHPLIQRYTVHRPPETMAATVMGASAQTV